MTLLLHGIPTRAAGLSDHIVVRRSHAVGDGRDAARQEFVRRSRVTLSPWGGDVFVKATHSESKIVTRPPGSGPGVRFV